MSKEEFKLHYPLPTSKPNKDEVKQMIKDFIPTTTNADNIYEKFEKLIKLINGSRLVKSKKDIILQEITNICLEIGKEQDSYENFCRELLTMARDSVELERGSQTRDEA